MIAPQPGLSQILVGFILVNFGRVYVAVVVNNRQRRSVPVKQLYRRRGRKQKILVHKGLHTNILRFWPV